MSESNYKGEFGFIRWISEKSSKHRNIPLSIGDDTCELLFQNKKSLLVSCDLLIEDIHFRVSHVPAALIGKKTAVANLSDIAAMGGRGLYFLLSLAVPEKLPKIWLNNFMEGLFEELNRFQVSLVGGDTSSSPEKIFINGTILGEVRGNRTIRRKGARCGDFIYVSGYVGEAAAALWALEKHFSEAFLSPDSLELARKTHYSRKPRLDLAAVISKESLATAMIDTSDGLVGDLAHLTVDFGLGATLWEDCLPISPLFPTLLKENKTNYFSYILNGGEDYELLFTSPKSPSCLQTLWKKPLFCIGKVVDSPEILLEKKNGEKILLNDDSFKHF